MTRTASGFDAYCRCPVVLKPNEIPEAMKKPPVRPIGRSPVSGKKPRDFRPFDAQSLLRDQKCRIFGQFGALFGPQSHIPVFKNIEIGTVQVNQHQSNAKLRAAHSITSSALASNLSETVMPSALAVFRLMINSTLVACWTGRSAGFSPLRI